MIRLLRSVRVLPLLCLAMTLPLQQLEASDAEHSGTRHLLEQYIAVWNGADPKVLDSILTQDFARRGGYGSASSKSEIQELISGFREFYGDLTINIEQIIPGDDKAAMRWRFTGSYGETSFEMNALNFGMYRIADGRISEEWVVGNTVDYWTSMGYTIMPPGTGMIPPPIDPAVAVEAVPPLANTAVLDAYIEQAASMLGKKAGWLELTTAIDCQVALDGRNIGWLPAGESATIPVARGAHQVIASSRGGSIFHRESIEARKGKRVTIALRSPGRVIVNPRNRTTEDLETGLMWQVTDNGSDISQDRAARHCSELDQGGHTDWRLPSILELERLYDPEAPTSRRFDTVAGVTLTGCCPWTSTPHGDFHWTFVFYNGLRYIKYRSIARFSRSLCVRETWISPASS